MARRRIGQEKLGFAVDRGRHSSLDELAKLIDWIPIERHLSVISCAAKGEPGWPPLALFKALLLSIWYDLSDVKLAEALDDRSSFRQFCGFSTSEPTPERTAFVRFRKALVAHELDRSLFEAITGQLKTKAIQVKTGTLVDATIIASASEDDGEAHWVKHKGKPAVHGFKAHIGADADTALVEEIAVTPISMTARPVPTLCPTIPARFSPIVPTEPAISARPSAPRVARHALSRPVCGAAMRLKRRRALTPGTNPFIGYEVGSRKSSAHGSEAMAFVACDGEDWPRQPCRFVSPSSPTTSGAA